MLLPSVLLLGRTFGSTTRNCGILIIALYTINVHKAPMLALMPKNKHGHIVMMTCGCIKYEMEMFIHASSSNI